MSAPSQLSPPLTLPVPPAELSATVTRLWEGAGGVASLAGVDWRIFGVLVGQPEHPEGVVRWCFAKHAEPYDQRLPRALSSLADALEALGLAVEREGGVRVIGWAAVEEWRRLDSPRPWPGKTVLVRIIDLDITDRRRSDHFAAVLERRLSRLSQDGPGVDVKRAHGVAQAEAHARSWQEDVKRAAHEKREGR